MVDDITEQKGASFDSSLFENNVDKIKIYHGADNFYAQANIESMRQTGQAALGGCPAGEERSNEFNSKMPLVGINIAKATSEGKGDPDSPLNRNINDGISLVQVFQLMAEKESTADTNGLHLKYLDKPIKRLVLIAQMEHYPFLNKIGQFLKLLKNKSGAKIPIEVDIVIEYDVQDFKDATDKFIDSQKAGV